MWRIQYVRLTQNQTLFDVLIVIADDHSQAESALQAIGQKMLHVRKDEFWLIKHQYVDHKK
jgi:hypothetical protein